MRSDVGFVLASNRVRIFRQLVCAGTGLVPQQVDPDHERSLLEMHRARCVQLANDVRMTFRSVEHRSAVNAEWGLRQR